MGKPMSHHRSGYTLAMTTELYVALGDSTGLGVGARAGGGYPERLPRRLRPTHPRLQLLNLRRSGATTADLIDEQLPRALRARPRLITIGIGINDIELQISDDAFAVQPRYEQWAERMYPAVDALLREEAPVR
jgi:lysophospholipase L1-like esterase